MTAYDDQFKDIPGTVVFDAVQSRLGYHLNMFCVSLMKAENRAAFKGDEGTYLAKWSMSAEQRQAVHEGLRQLRPEHRQLLLMLTADPQIPYQEIRRLGIPTGSIGPTRARCLRKLRDTSPVRALLAS